MKAENLWIAEVMELQKEIKRLRDALKNIMGEYESILHAEFCTPSNPNPCETDDALIQARKALKGE